MANRLPITIRVDHFEGPLDLLLYLIQSHELDVSKVSISKITDQYLAYVRLMQELNFDVASDFLLMAATLIQWKSKSLLPQEIDPNALLAEGDDVLTPEELLRQLMEHQRFLEMGRELGTLTLLGEDVYSRPNTRKPTEKVWKLMEISELALTYQDLLVKERKRTTILKKETVSLAEKIRDFGDRMEIGKLTGLRALLRDPDSRPETVVSFLAALELGRLKKLKVFQEKAYEEIYVELLESIKGFDTSLASGFDSIEAAVDKGVAEKHAHDAELTDAERAARYVSDEHLPARRSRSGASAESAAASGTADAGSTGTAGDSAPSGAADLRGTEASPTDFGGAEDSSSTGDFAEGSAADFDRAENSPAIVRGTEIRPAGIRGAENTTGSGDSTRSGMAGIDSDDLGFGTVLSGTHHGDGKSSPGGDLTQEFAGRNPSTADGGRDADLHGRDS